jgi:hypothetical protein
MQLAAILMICGFSFMAGAMFLLAYILHRMMGNSGWDDSNITNALRLLSHVTLHPEDFGKMYYLTSDQLNAILLSNTAYDNPPIRPFWYVSKDELSEVVDSRPQ